MPEVKITHACADQCASRLAMTSEQARSWLRQRVGLGEITADLPAPFTGRRSRSGYFLLIPDLVALPLAVDEESGDYVATGCLLFPSWLHRHGLGGPVIDPFALSGADLVRHVRLSDHCLQRFAERCGGSHQRDVARRQLVDALTSDARARAERPDWTRSRRDADFFLVADDEFCLPVQRYGSDGEAFEATTLLHRSQRLFEAVGDDLERCCRLDESVLAKAKRIRPRSTPHPVLPWLREQIASSGRLSWKPPRRRRRHRKARFYLLVGRRYYLPVGWEKDGARPLVGLDIRHSRALPWRWLNRWLP